MWIPSDTGDYRLLDCSDGERLELWKDKILVRPDPQVIWRSARTDKRWNSADARYSRSSSGGGSWSENSLPESWRVRVSGLLFRIKPMGFKHTGLFPEQAANWEWFSELIKNAGRQISVLNLFAYTGGATVACAAAGAKVCHVDAAKNMVSLAKENAALNSLADAPIRYIVDDCSKFVAREKRRGSRYDAVIMDPPSYGRGPGGETWKLEDSIHSFISEALSLLSDDPLFVLVNSYTTGLSAGTVDYLLRLASKDLGGRTESAELGLRVGSTGLCLPCGASSRWSR
ncbi:MAG: class I SAM-dependent methyltransferase [Clostridia bacterium]|nr:class I SAM-dependent methyltransferase [Clostridia bacterium]